LLAQRFCGKLGFDLLFLLDGGVKPCEFKLETFPCFPYYNAQEKRGKKVNVEDDQEKRPDSKPALKRVLALFAFVIIFLP
jgi:hypothetical protein